MAKPGAKNLLTDISGLVVGNAHDGQARTGKSDAPARNELALSRLGALAADCLTRAVARGIYEAKILGKAKARRDYTLT